MFLSHASLKAETPLETGKIVWDDKKIVLKIFD